MPKTQYTIHDRNGDYVETRKDKRRNKDKRKPALFVLRADSGIAFSYTAMDGRTFGDCTSRRIRIAETTTPEQKDCDHTAAIETLNDALDCMHQSKGQADAHLAQAEGVVQRNRDTLTQLEGDITAIQLTITMLGGEVRQKQKPE